MAQQHQYGHQASDSRCSRCQTLRPNIRPMAPAYHRKPCLLSCWLRRPRAPRRRRAAGCGWPSAPPRRWPGRGEGVLAALGLDRRAARVGPHDQRHPEPPRLVADLPGTGRSPLRLPGSPRTVCSTTGASSCPAGRPAVPRLLVPRRSSAWTPGGMRSSRCASRSAAPRSPSGPSFSPSWPAGIAAPRLPSCPLDAEADACTERQHGARVHRCGPDVRREQHQVGRV